MATSLAPSNTLFDAIRGGDPSIALASLYESIEVRTSFSPPVRARTQDLFKPGEPNSRPPWWLKVLKPTFVVRGAIGEQVIAPGGVAGDGTIPMLLVIGSLVGLGFLLGRATK